jgi:hypothetical protein
MSHGHAPWVGLLLLCAGVWRGVAATSGDGFQDLFDGRSLTGWTTPDPSYWTVEE